jgi:hypothetical protein
MIKNRQTDRPEHGEREKEKESLRKSNSVTENGPLNDFMDRRERDAKRERERPIQMLSH